MNLIRRHKILAAIVSVIATGAGLFAVAVIQGYGSSVGSDLERGSAGKVNASPRVTDAHALLVTASYDWVPEDGFLFAFPKPLAGSQRARVLGIGDAGEAPRALRGMGGVRFAESQRLPRGATLTRIRLTIHNAQRDSILLTGISAVIIKRRSPLAGTTARGEPQGDQRVTKIGIDLDSRDPIARSDANGKLGQSYFQVSAPTVESRDKVFEVEAIAGKGDYTWRVVVMANVHGKPQKFFAHGPQFESTALAKRYALSYSFDFAHQRFKRVSSAGRP